MFSDILPSFYCACLVLLDKHVNWMSLSGMENVRSHEFGYYGFCSRKVLVIIVML